MNALRSLRAPLLAIALLALSACEPEPSSTASPTPVIEVGGVPLKMELALTSAEQRKGLMFRDGIAEDHGMLFVYDQPTQMSFWMKNVDFDIHIGFFTADGVLREIYPMYARDTGSRKSKRDDLLYALEVSRGWFSRNGVMPGAQLDLEALEAAIQSHR